MESQTPTTIKGVHQLNGWLASLGQFISRFTNRLKPFFTTLKGLSRPAVIKNVTRPL